MARTIFITGSNRGIGFAVLNKFSKKEQDSKIIAHARIETPEFLEKLASLKNNNIEPVYFDLLDTENLKKQVSAIIKSYKKIDVLINNAGVVKAPKSFLMCDENTLRETFEINFFAQVFITQLITRAMIRNNSGAIVNLASVAGISGIEGQFEYVASKSAVIGMTKRLAIELAPYKIRVNAVAPGMTDTEMMSNMENNLREKLLSNSISKRLAQPDEIADVIYFLTSVESSYINGQILTVNGGGYVF